MKGVMDKKISQLKKQGNMYFPESATEEQIAEFERTHQFRLPCQLREWLKVTDGGECFLPAGIQLYGVAHKPLIDVDDNDRPDNTYVVIGTLATGDPILCRKDGEQIAIYNHGAGRIEQDEIYPDFLSFIDDLHNLLGIEV